MDAGASGLHPIYVWAIAVAILTLGLCILGWLCVSFHLGLCRLIDENSFRIKLITAYAISWLVGLTMTLGVTAVYIVLPNPNLNSTQDGTLIGRLHNATLPQLFQAYAVGLVIYCALAAWSIAKTVRGERRWKNQWNVFEEQGEQAFKKLSTDEDWNKKPLVHLVETLPTAPPLEVDVLKIQGLDFNENAQTILCGDFTKELILGLTLVDILTQLKMANLPRVSVGWVGQKENSPQSGTICVVSERICGWLSIAKEGGVAVLQSDVFRWVTKAQEPSLYRYWRPSWKLWVPILCLVQVPGFYLSLCCGWPFTTIKWRHHLQLKFGASAVWGLTTRYSPRSGDWTEGTFEREKPEQGLAKVFYEAFQHGLFYSQRFSNPEVRDEFSENMRPRI